MTKSKKMAPKLTVIALGGSQLIEDSVGFPPPMVFRLSEFCFPIVTIEVGPVGVDALQPLGPEIKKAFFYVRPSDFVYSRSDM